MTPDRTPGTILMTADTVGGVWVYALELARLLGSAGTRVVLASMGGEPSPSQKSEAANVERLILEWRPYRLEWMQDPWADMEEAGSWLLELERTYHPSIIHLNNFVHGALPWSAPVLVVGHSCVCSWYEAVRGSAIPAAWHEYRERVARGLSAADAVVAPTWSMLTSLRKHYGSFQSAGAVHNARRMEGLRPLETREVVLTAGRLWDAAKNARALDAAAAGLDVPVYAAGSTESPEGSKVAFRHLSTLGVLSQQELTRRMGHAAIYALPARYEPFGLTALEAAQCGCALVLGDIPTLREVWGDAAVFVSPDDHGRLRHVLQELIGNVPLRQNLTARAMRRAEWFSTTRMTAGYLRVYADLLARRDPDERKPPSWPIRPHERSTRTQRMNA